jgi:23S rRNA (adenine2503-C2)-methyltransferase
MKPLLFNLTQSELEQFVAGLGQPKFRAKQIAEWLNRGAPDFSVMKNLPEELRAKLDESALTLPCSVVKKLESSDGQTTKFLLRMNDNEAIETVLMRTTYGNSVCVSSQAGCAMGCKFCASTLLGLRRNLTANEMLAQVLVAQWELKKDDGARAVSHIVVMGTGEPLQNYDNLREFLEAANSRLGVSWRKMTVSTCGIVPGIKKLTEWGQPVNLAISLHAPNDELRGALMPINAKHPIREVLDAAFENSEKTGRQLMIEYLLLSSGVIAGAAQPQPATSKDDLCAERFVEGGSGLAPDGALRNDTLEHAAQLAELLRGQNCMVNLIPWNAVAERSDFAAPSGNAVHRFQDSLIAAGIHTRIRRERGADIGSACGQLRLGSS